MIDLVFWSFAVAALPMVLALAGSMVAGALGRPTLRPDPWTQPDRLRLVPTEPPALGHARLDRTGSRF